MMMKMQMGHITSYFVELDFLNGYLSSRCKKAFQSKEDECSS